MAHHVSPDWSLEIQIGSPVSRSEVSRWVTLLLLSIATVWLTASCDAARHEQGAAPTHPVQQEAPATPSSSASALEPKPESQIEEPNQTAEQFPDDLLGRSALSLLYAPYVNARSYGLLCGEESEATLDSDYPPIAHGLSSDSEMPPALLQFFAALGVDLETYQHRWFEELRIVLFARHQPGPNQIYVASVLEIALLDGDPPAWAVVVEGGRYICE